MVAGFRTADDEMARESGGEFVTVSEWTSGDLGRVVASALLPAGFRNGEARPALAGVPDRDIGGVGRLIEGLSQEEKKSSSVSPVGVALPEAALATSVTTT